MPISPRLRRLSRQIKIYQLNNTSTRDPHATRRAVAVCVSDPDLRAALSSCSGDTPCWSPACPVCAGRRGRRYYRQSLAPATASVSTPDLCWVTVNVLATDTLAEGAALIAGTEHRALRHLIQQLRLPRLIRAASATPHHHVRVWGAREVEPIRQPGGSFRWLWHWHLIVDLDGLDADVLADALRARWPGPRAVRVEPVRAKSAKQRARALRNLASYPVKSRYTHRVGEQRQWLPPEVIDALAQWRASQPSRWTRFAIR